MMALEVDPDLVRPGWTPLVVLVLLGIVLFFLGRSMLKQFGKIDVPADHEPTTGPVDAAGPHPPPERGHPPIPDLRSRTPGSGGDAGPPDQR